VKRVRVDIRQLCFRQQGTRVSPRSLIGCRHAHDVVAIFELVGCAQNPCVELRVMRAALSPNEAEDILAWVGSAERRHRFSRLGRQAAVSGKSSRDHGRSAGESPQKGSPAGHGCLDASGCSNF